MIRNTMLGLSLFALMTGSALAATPAHKTHVSKPRTVAAAPAGDAAKADKADKADAPKADAPKAKGKGKTKAPKGDKGGETKTEMKSAPAPETK
jgi:hypothetical protein